MRANGIGSGRCDLDHLRQFTGLTRFMVTDEMLPHRAYSSDLTYRSNV